MALKIVRTVAGARRYQQPKGSIIVRDGSQPLDALVGLANDRQGYEKVADVNGNVYYVGNVDDKWVVESGMDGSRLKEFDASESAFEWLNQEVGGAKAPKASEEGVRLEARPNVAPGRARDRLELQRTFGLSVDESAAVQALSDSELAKYRKLRERGLGHIQAYRESRESGQSGNPNKKGKKDILDWTPEVKVHGHRTLERAPGKNDNWVESTGSLPPYIEHIAQALHERQGMTISRAIATAISRVKVWAAGGDNVTAKTRAKAIKALAQWEALKAKNKARRKK